MRALTATLALLVVAVLAPDANAQNALDTARPLFARYHEDLRDLERARDLLQAAAEREPSVEVLSALARAWFLLGEFQARTDRERLAAYERGREIGQRAVDLHRERRLGEAGPDRRGDRPAGHACAETPHTAVRQRDFDLGLRSGGGLAHRRLD